MKLQRLSKKLRLGAAVLLFTLISAVLALHTGKYALADSKIIHHGQVKKKPMQSGGKGRVSWLGEGRCPISRFKNQRSLFLVPEDFWHRHKREQIRQNPFLLLNYYKDKTAPPTSLELEGPSRAHIFFVDWQNEWGGKRLVFSILHTPQDKMLSKPLAAVVGESGLCKERMAHLSLFMDPGRGKAAPGALMKRSQWEKSRAFGPRKVVVSTLKGFKDFGDGIKSPLAGKKLGEIKFELIPAGVTLY